MSKPDEYRANAEYCREMAAKANGPLDREGWLQEAANWQTLASLSDQQCSMAAAEMNMAEIWENLASRLLKGTAKA